jgi:hypothetical protein
MPSKPEHHHGGILIIIVNIIIIDNNIDNPGIITDNLGAFSCPQHHES